MTRKRKALGKPHRLGLFAILLSLITVLPAQAENVAFAIDPQDLSAALKLFAVQSHREIFFTQQLTRGKKSKGVKGTFDDIMALKVILEGTGLSFSVTASNAILVNDPRIKRDSSQAGASTASGSAPQDTDNPTGLAKSSTTSQSQSVPVNQVVPNNAPTSDAAIPEILVTGSRILNVDVTRTIDDPQPYYIFDSQTIEESGATDVEDFLKQRLTMNTVGLTSSQQYQSQGASGLGTTSSVNLRGLGTNETLILVDGRRMAGVTVFNGSPSNLDGQPDLNSIPLAAIERIEVLPSSASAIYGGNAIGGVVNVILKKNYDGGELKATYANTFTANAPIPTLDASYGFGLEGGKTHVMLTAHYSDAQPLLEGEREDITQRGISTILANYPGYFAYFGGFRGGLTPNIVSGDGSNLVLNNGTPLNSAITHIPKGATASTPLSAGLLANAGGFDYSLSPGVGEYGAQQPLGTFARTTSGMMSVRREMTSWLDIFTDASVAENRGSSVYNSFSDNAFFVPNTAPTNPFSNPNGVDVTIPNDLSFPFTSTSTTVEVSSGLIAKLPNNWGVEADYTWSQNRFSYLYTYLDYTQVQNDLNSGALNPFVDTIAHPPNLSQYMYPQTYDGSSTVNDVAVHASGPILHLPWGVANLTVGIEHRKEGYPDSTQYNGASAESLGGNLTTYIGHTQSTNSVYAELNAPLVTAANAIPGIQGIDLQFAGRAEAYDVHTGVNSESEQPGSNPPVIIYNPSLDANGLIPVPSTIVSYHKTSPTVAIKYKPIQDITMRASIAEAFLPPNYSQLLPNPAPNPSYEPTIYDPQTHSSYPVQITSGGNPNIKPQNSRSLDIGIIYQPTEESLKGLRMDLEYYNIKQSDFITSLTPQQYVDSFPSRLTRNPSTGRITLINGSFVNANQFDTEGWDASIDYRKPTSAGTFDFYTVATLFSHEYRQLAFGEPTLDYVGWANSGGDPKIKLSATLSWAFRRWLVNWSTNWIDSYKQAGAPGDPTFYGGIPNNPTTNPLFTAYTAAQGGYAVPSQMYHNLFASYSFDSQSGRHDSDNGRPRSNGVFAHVTLQAGIKNVFNHAPPFDAYYQPFFYSPYGDIQLRSYWLSLKKDF